MSKINTRNLPLFHIDMDRYDLCIGGYEKHILENCFLMPAFGCRYHEYGIADNSILLCSPDAPVVDMDLVIAEGDGGPAVFIFATNPNYSADGNKSVLYDKDLVKAKIMGSFNFYQ